MKQVLLSQGKTVVADVPCPELGDKELLIAIDYSCISGGTEGAAVSQSQEPIVKRALKHPENVVAAVNLIRDEGLSNGLRKIRGILQNFQTLGYSAVGTVIEIGSDVSNFSPGDTVACAGAGIANHAEFNTVPVNLCVKIEPTIDKIAASTVTLGAIALQGVRRANPQLGDNVAVIGLGALGQIASQLLNLNGCNVVAIDTVEAKCQVAVEKGAGFATSDQTKFTNYIDNLTDGEGVDCAIICASGASHSIVSNAAKICRRKGKVILVGDVGLNLKREDFYQKEIDFLISTSYGPGRYDPVYEQGGVDYPYAYVRWTENRNMSTYLDLISKGKIDFKKILSKPVSIDEAATAFENLKKSDGEAFLYVLDYQNNRSDKAQTVVMGAVTNHKKDVLNVCVVGAGSFAQAMHFPNFNKLRNKYRISSVVSKTGVTGANIAKSYNIDAIHTDFKTAIDDPAIDLVFICAPHDKHAEVVSYALEKNKLVFVEKPLCLNWQELGEIEKHFNTHSESFLMVGYNRRFSPLIKSAKEHLDNTNSPKIITYMMNAGALPKNHWAKSKQQGGRNIGEACHIYDLFNYLVGALPVSGCVAAIKPVGASHTANENFSVTLKYEDGSICHLIYTSLGSTSYPKETMTVVSGGSVLQLGDYKKLEIHDASGTKVYKEPLQNKGHLEELKELYACLKGGHKWPISYEELITTSKVSFLVEEKIQANDLSEFEILREENAPSITNK